MGASSAGFADATNSRGRFGRGAEPPSEFTSGASMSFEIIPAVDIKRGRCVRLLQGRGDAETVFGHDPAAMARQWQEAGAPRLHVVDLDGAFEGKPVQTQVIAGI